MAETVNVAIVGAGRAATPLIQDFLNRPFIKIVGIADKNPDSPGAVLARENGILFTEHADVLAAKGSEIDLLFDLSGDPSVKPALKDAFVVQGNRTTIIAHDLIARLIQSICQGSDTLIEAVHPADRGIG
ncbi:MAG: Gfo/Idh/MocA family oxidoreductase [Coriobacteriia bacterium]